MASKRTMFCSIMDAPGPFRLIMEEGGAYEKCVDQFIVEFLVGPITKAEIKRLNHPGFRVSFEVALRGATTVMEHKKGEPKNVRFLGRFLTCEPLFDWAPSALTQWQWEVVFNPHTRKGMVFKLGQPLPEEWTR